MTIPHPDAQEIPNPQRAPTERLVTARLGETPRLRANIADWWAGEGSNLAVNDRSIYQPCGWNPHVWAAVRFFPCDLISGRVWPSACRWLLLPITPIGKLAMRRGFPLVACTSVTRWMGGHRMWGSLWVGARFFDRPLNRAAVFMRKNGRRTLSSLSSPTPLEETNAKVELKL